MGTLELGTDDLLNLYGPVIYLMPEGDGATPKVEPVVETKVEPVVETKVEPVVEAKVEPVVEPLVEKAEPVMAEVVPGISWRPKPGSKLLFVLHKSELHDKALGEFLKKIVSAIGIPFEAAGFGIIGGPVDAEEWESMPNPYGIVFDPTLHLVPENPVQVGAGQVYFTQRLADLEQNTEAKRALWSYLKNILSLIA